MAENDPQVSANPYPHGTPPAPPTYAVIQPAGQYPPPVAPVQQVAAPSQPAPPPDEDEAKEKERKRNEVVIYSHSNLFYWWPVWVIGYVMAAVTYANNQQYEVGAGPEYFHPSSNVGVIFFSTLFIVIVITNINVRGMASGMVILVAILVVVLLAYFGLWDQILSTVAALRVHLNLGAYFWFSTLMFIAWAFAFFIVDRMTYWVVKPGQITRVGVLGAASRSWDTDNLVLEKHRDDLFRHWILGLGTGDLHIHTYGAQRETLFVPNVLFLGSRVEKIQRLIAAQPGGSLTVK